MRKKSSGKKDKKYFRKNAAKTKAVNIRPKVMRGGIRL